MYLLYAYFVNNIKINGFFTRGTSQVPVYFVCASFIRTQLTDLGHLIQHNFIIV